MIRHARPARPTFRLTPGNGSKAESSGVSGGGVTNTYNRIHVQRETRPFRGKRFFKRMMRAEHRRLPFSISVDKNATYPEAFSTSQAERLVPQYSKLRRVKYLNNVIEQDPRFVKKKVRDGQCFKSFHTAERTLEGIEVVNMMVRKGQVKRLAGSDAQGQAKFVESLFGIAA
jgi:IS6 family transposase